jgi:hypothetical protein
MSNTKRRGTAAKYPKISLDARTMDVLHLLAQRDGCSMADVVRRLARASAFAVYGVTSMGALMEIRAANARQEGGEA